MAEEVGRLSPAACPPGSFPRKYVYMYQLLMIAIVLHELQSISESCVFF